MSRDPLHAVTLPAFVKVESAREIEGWCSLFPDETSEELAGLREVKASDIRKRAEEWKRSQPKVRRLCVAISMMKLAYGRRDQSAFEQALTIAWNWIPLFSKGGGKPGLGKLRGAKAWRSANQMYSGLMSNLLQSSRFVFLHANDGRLRPGLYCPNWDVAAFAFIGAGIMRVCPYSKCGRFFIPETANQNCCTAAHGVNFRTERSRARKKKSLH